MDKYTSVCSGTEETNTVIESDFVQQSINSTTQVSEGVNCQVTVSSYNQSEWRSFWSNQSEVNPNQTKSGVD